MIVLWLAIGCAPSDGVLVCSATTDPEIPSTLEDDPTLWTPSPDLTPLALRFDLTATAPACLQLDIDDGTTAWTLASEGAATSHRLPVLGAHADRTLRVDWTAWDTHDQIIGTGTLEADTPPLPDRFPQLEVLVHQLDRMEPGHVLLDLKVPASDEDPPDGEEIEPEPAYLVVLDENLEVVWYFDSPDKIGAVALNTNQQLVGLTNGNAVTWDWFGEVQQTWRSNANAADPIAVDARDFHHEALPQPDGGIWTLSFDLATVDAYPESYSQPTVLGPEAVIDDPVALRIAADGTIEKRWTLADRLDTTRIGYDSLDRLNKERWDWAHANALTQDPSDGGLLVSLRHQDAIIKLSTSGELVWILASPTGWQEAFQPYLLAPIGDVDWPYHQHGPRLTDDGTLLVFDNGTRGHNPYEADSTEPTDESRVVAYDIDEAAHTVRQVWEYRQTLTGELYASALGGVDPLPETGNVLASFGFLAAEGGLDNQDAGRGTRSIRLIQFHPDDLANPAFDLRLGSDRDVEPEGWKSYRAEPIPRLQDLTPG